MYRDLVIKILACIIMLNLSLLAWLSNRCLLFNESLYNSVVITSCVLHFVPNKLLSVLFIHKIIYLLYYCVHVITYSLSFAPCLLWHCMCGGNVYAWFYFVSKGFTVYVSFNVNPSMHTCKHPNTIRLILKKDNWIGISLPTQSE